MSLTYNKIECLHFPTETTGIIKRACHFDVASSPFKYHFGALLWPRGTLNKSSKFIKCIEGGDVVVLLAGGVAEVPKEQAGK